MTNETNGNESRSHAENCQQCGAPLGIAWTPGAATEAAGHIPPGVKGWSWGAFLLNIFWALGNRTWIGLLMLVPYVWYVMPFVLGYKGREWAWQNRRWESFEQFQQVQRDWTIAGIVLVGGLAILTAIAIPATREMTVRHKLIRADLAIDPVKEAVVKVYKAKHKLPAMHTIITAENQGKPATKDWAALGFKELPKLPPEITRLEFSGRDSPEIVVELAKIGDTFDGTSLRAKLIAADGKLSWKYEATSSDPRAAHFVRYLGGPVREPAKEDATCKN